VIAIASVLGCRDFAGVATLSLASIYLQKAHGLTPKQTGFIIGAMMLITIVINPIAVYLSPGRRRLPMLAGVLVAGGMVLVTVPLWPVAMVLPVMCLFQMFQLGSYAVSDAAMLERVSPQVRGRVVGVFLTIAGTFSSLSPFVMGLWTDLLGNRAAQPPAYIPIFGTLAAMMLVSALSTRLIPRLGDPVVAIEPITETSPATAEPAL
jgi:MFS family permease